MAIPYYSYCYGFNRRRLNLLAQGLLQSVPSLQASVTMPYYSIAMVSIGYAKISNVKIPLFQDCLNYMQKRLKVIIFKVLSAEFYFHKTILN